MRNRKLWLFFCPVVKKLPKFHISHSSFLQSGPVFVNLENGLSVKKSHIIGIFNMDTATVSDVTREFLKTAEKEFKVVYASKRVPESFVIADDGISENVYVSSFAAETVLGRVNEK